jgi:hypothetical protein
MQLGKLGVPQDDQEDSCKTAPSEPQSHQRVVGVSQNAGVDPPDKKRRPGSTGIERGSDRKSKKLSHQTSTEQHRSTQEPDREISVYDGRTRQAGIAITGDEFVVVMADGALLGTFNTLVLARAAISAAHGGGR